MSYSKNRFAIQQNFVLYWRNVFHELYCFFSVPLRVALIRIYFQSGRIPFIAEKELLKSRVLIPKVL